MLVVRHPGSPLIVRHRVPIQVILAGLAAAAGIILLFRSIFGGARRDGVYFYDVSAGRLFVAPRGSISPIRGIDGPGEDAFRAVVITRTGDPEDRRFREIAYLERYSPELKQQMEAAQAGGPPPALGRGASATHRWVRRTNDAEWVPLGSEAGERIVAEWAHPDARGVSPAVCSP